MHVYKQFMLLEEYPEQSVCLSEGAFPVMLVIGLSSLCK